jgi:hypothetical protein
MSMDPRLRPLLARIAAAEQELDRLRASARSVAQAYGISTARLFGETAFIPRETADRWVQNSREDAVNDDDALSNAYARGKRAGRQEETAKFLKHTEALVAIRDARARGEPGQYEHLRDLPRLLRERRQRTEPEPTAPDPQDIAKLILAAGAKARGAPSPLPPVGSPARQILDAGMKRRGKNPDDQSTIPQDDEGAPNCEDDDEMLDDECDDLDDDDLDDDERERRRKRRKLKKRTETDDDGVEGDTDELDERERARLMRTRMLPETPARQPNNVVDMANAIIAAGRKARGLPPLKK